MVEVITDPVAVAAEFCEFGKRRMESMQPKWFRRYDGAPEHKVWFSDKTTTARSSCFFCIFWLLNSHFNTKPVCLAF